MGTDGADACFRSLLILADMENRLATILPLWICGGAAYGKMLHEHGSGRFVLERLSGPAQDFNMRRHPSHV